MPAGPEWLDIIRSGERLAAAAKPTPAQREDYFALCLACHWATVATYIPTDVDSKIRGHCWQQSDREHLRRMFAIARRAHGWDIAGVSRRYVETPRGRISGHDGEWLGVMIGALGALHAAGDAEFVDQAATDIDAELQREAAAFLESASKPGREIDCLRLAAILTHNAGDIDQGFRYWRANADTFTQKFGELAHERPQSYSGAFNRAAALYKRLLAAEGHRHYPLREVAALRAHADLLLPIGPFFDGWGESVATHPALKERGRAETLGALLNGCKKVRNQVGYYRAIAGMSQGCDIERLARDLPTAPRSMLNDATVRKHLQTPAAAFESGYIKQVRAISSGK